MTEVTYTQHLKKLSSVAAGFTAYVVATDRIKCPVGYQADYVFLKNSKIHSISYRIRSGRRHKKTGTLHRFFYDDKTLNNTAKTRFLIFSRGISLENKIGRGF